MALTERTGGVSMYALICRLLEAKDWRGLGARLEAVREKVLRRCALTVCCHGSEAARERLAPSAARQRLCGGGPRPRPELLRAAAPAPARGLHHPQGGVNYDVLVWPNGDPSATRKVLAQVMSYEYLWQTLREKGGAYGAGMLNRPAYELFYTYPRPPRRRPPYRRYGRPGAAVAGIDFTPEP